MSTDTRVNQRGEVIIADPPFARTLFSSTRFAWLWLSVLILAWKVAGWYGLDRWLLPLLGTPWQPGELVARADPPPERQHQADR